MKDKLLLLLALVLGLCSCQKGESEYDDSPQANLNALWTIIDQQYCFLDYKEQELGISWADIRAKYSARLNPKMSRSQLFEVLCQMLGELKDGHVNISSSVDLGRNWSWKEDYPLNLDEEVRNAYLQNDYNLAAGLKYRILPDNIAYVVYESFQSAIGEGNLDDMFFGLRMCNGMILDIRGNGGGELTNVEKLASHFTNEKVLVPTYGQEENDRQAISTIASAFPGRKMVAIDSRPIIRQHGSIHCCTMQLPLGVVKD